MIYESEKNMMQVKKFTMLSKSKREEVSLELTLM